VRLGEAELSDPRYTRWVGVGLGVSVEEILCVERSSAQTGPGDDLDQCLGDTVLE